MSKPSTMLWQPPWPTHHGSVPIIPHEAARIDCRGCIVDRCRGTMPSLHAMSAEQRSLWLHRLVLGYATRRNPHGLRE